MAITHVANGSVYVQKADNNFHALVFNSAGTIQAGDLVVGFIGFDNTGASTPTVLSISKPSDETATWTKITGGWNTVSSAGGGTRGELWAIRTTVAWGTSGGSESGKPWGQVELSAVVQSRFTAVSVFRGAGLSFANADARVYPTFSTASRNAYAGELLIGCAVSENNSVLTGEDENIHGTWSTAQTGFTTGGGAASNLTGIMQYKLVTGGNGVLHVYGPTGMGGDGGFICAVIYPYVAPNAGTASGSHTWSGTATAPTTGGGQATGSASWSGTAQGAKPLQSPVFEHGFTGASSATHGYIELHFKAETFDRVLEVQRKTFSQGAESYVTVHTSATIPANEEYVFQDPGFLLADSTGYHYQARQSVTTPTPQTSGWAGATPSPYGKAEPYLGDDWLSWLEVFDNGVTWDAISGVVTVSGYEHYFSGNGYKADGTTNNWFEGRNLHLELNGVGGEETCYLSSVTSLRKTRFCQLNLNNKIYVVGAELAGSYTTAVYAFSGSGWSTSGNPALPTAQAWVAAAIGTKIYAIGANNAFRVWDTAGAAAWSTLTYSGTSAPHWVAALGGKLYVYCQDGSFKSYDPDTATWTTGLTAPTSPYLTSNLASNPIGMESRGRIYLYGGRTATESEHDYTNNLWHYDAAADEWGSDQTVAGPSSHGTLTYSAHWDALLVGLYRVTTVDGAFVGNSSPDMIRPIEPGQISDGSGSGTTGWSGIATGLAQRSGSAAGTHAWAGTATSEGLKQGAASGAHSWIATASGTRQPAAAATGSATWTAVTSGTTARAGSSAGTTAWAATTSGTAPRRATMTAGGDFGRERAHSQTTACRFFRNR